MEVLVKVSDKQARRLAELSQRAQVAAALLDAYIDALFPDHEGVKDVTLLNNQLTGHTEDKPKPVDKED